MFAFIAYSISLVAPMPPTTYTIAETVIYAKAPESPATRCHTRDLVQGSGTVKVCEVSR